MPARNLQRITEGDVYCHIYNRGIDNRIIFVDDSDYCAFLGFLEDYLSTPRPPEEIKKDFTINNRTFKGVPHQPKNYSEKVELIAYSLKPDHFHLLLHQKTEKSLQALLRSLCTRYSMYFNKKYGRTGPLLDGPYKSVQVKDEKELLLLTRYLHKEGGYSTYPEFTGQKQTPWVKTKIVLNAKINTDNYKDFVENYKHGEEEERLLGKIAIENADGYLERSNPERVQLKPSYRIPEIIGACALFVLLLGFGLRNVASAAKSQETAPATLGTNTLSPTPTAELETSSTPTPEPESKTTVTIKSEDGPVNIREKPTIYSDKIGEASDGDTFEFVSKSPEWIEVKLDDGSNGFIFSKYVDIGNVDIEIEDVDTGETSR